MYFFLKTLYCFFFKDTILLLKIVSLKSQKASCHRKLYFSMTGQPDQTILSPFLFFSSVIQVAGRFRLTAITLPGILTDNPQSIQG